VAVEMRNAELLDGREIHIRPISPGDGDALVRFHQGLSDETTRLRFFVLHPELACTEVVYFTHVDHHDREALLALVGDDIVGVGRYDRIPRTSDAEVAFVVADGWQGSGIGTHLLEHLVHRATEEGVTRFLADTLAENYRMRGVFRDSGLLTESVARAEVVHVVLDLQLEPAVLHGRV
jgi:GNAT superfamily N-acetyltransferase